MKEVNKKKKFSTEFHGEKYVRSNCSSNGGFFWLVNLFVFIFLLTFTFPVFAQNRVQPWWLSLEQGKQKFRSRDYGGALLLFEDARRQRRAMYERMERDFINLLSTREARIIGDALDRIEQFSRDRHYTAVTAALEELFYRVPRSTFFNSAEAALLAFEKLKDYPEAEYWIGEIYRVDGELLLALSQYRKAYSMRETLEDPGFSVTLQYKIADILRVRQEYTEMQSVYDSIITELDTLWVNSNRGDISRQNVDTTARNPVPVPYAEASASFARRGMKDTLEREGVNRFLVLYRYNNGPVEQAHRNLGFFYVVRGRPSAQDHLMFAFLIQNTIIIEEIKRRQFDYTFTDLSALSLEINRNAMLVNYVNEVEYYRTAYYLAASLFRNRRPEIARSIWEFLADQPQAGEWSSRAVTQLRDPHVEPLVETTP